MKIYLTEKQFKNYISYLKEETVGGLIKKLQKYPKDMNVDCNDTHGTYSTIKGIKKQKWEEGETKHECVTILHDKYDKQESVVESLCNSLINEDYVTPDSVGIAQDGITIVDWQCHHIECSPRPFGYDSNGNLFVGEIGEYHSELERRIKHILDNECGRFWQNEKFVTMWGAGDNWNCRNFIEQLMMDVKQYGIDLSDSYFLYEKNEVAMIVPMVKFINGDDGESFIDFLTGNNKKEEVYPWSKMPGNSEAEKRENWYAWNGKQIDEEKKKPSE